MDIVKPVPYRKWQALQTRSRISKAARSAFARGGFAATSIEAIAREAGVATRTVYATFGDKKAILGAICDDWLAESNVGEAVNDIMSESDPRRRLALIAHLNRQQWELGMDVIPMLEAAAASDAAVARMLDGWKEQRVGLLKRAIEGLRGRSRRGLTVGRASATVVALSVPEVFNELVARAGWTPDEYERWLADLFAYMLLN
jgi:AcrR family transcriptional regulator